MFYSIIYKCKRSLAKKSSCHRRDIEKSESMKYALIFISGKCESYLKTLLSLKAMKPFVVVDCMYWQSLMWAHPSGTLLLKFYFATSNEVSAILHSKAVFYFREAGNQTIKIIYRLINWQFPWCHKRRTSMKVFLTRYLPLDFLKHAHIWAAGITQRMKKLMVNGHVLSGQFCDHRNIKWKL